MQRRDRIDAYGATLLIIFLVLLGLNQVMIKIVNIGLQPVFQAALRSIIAAPLVFAYAFWFRRTFNLRDGSLWPGVAAGVLFGIEFILLFQSLEWTSVSRASMFFYTMPFWVAAAAHFLIPGERMTLVRFVGLVLAVVGVALALLDNAKPATDKAWLGDILCLVGSMLWAGIAILARTTDLKKSAPEMQLFYQLSVSSFILLIAAPFFGAFIREPTIAIMSIFAVQVLGVVCVGFLTWFWVLSIYPASDMASFGFLTPLFGVLFGWLTFDEHISISFVVALALVCVGIVLVNRKPRKKMAVKEPRGSQAGRRARPER